MDAGVTELKAIKVSGPVSVDRVDSVPDKHWNILIMGPIGAGKSRFIETLGWHGAHKISSSGLDGFTQSVTAYRLNNATTHDLPIYLIDSPGFSDAKISELAIVSMVTKWLRDNNAEFFGTLDNLARTVLNRVIYLTPITPARLAGSQRLALRTFQILTGITAANQTTIVTTMWNTVWGESASQRAERNFIQLQEDIWKVLISTGSQIIKFHNTHASALSVLDQAISHSRGGETFAIEKLVQYNDHVRRSPFAVNVYTDLQDRVQNMQLERAHCQSALEEANTGTNTQLQSRCRSRLEEVEKDLSRFQKELEDFGEPPKPLPYDPLVSMPLSGIYKFAIQTPRPSSSAVPPRTETSPDVPSVPIIPPASQSVSESSPSQAPDAVTMAGHSAQVEAAPSPIERDRAQRGRFARAVNLLKCWGKHYED